jgi:DNA-binding GntR family transcriptional regulator
MTVKPVSRENLSSQLYSSLRAALMEGQFAPGQRLTISTVAEEYGTSITPVREAIFRLVSERALEVRAATSVQVPRMGPADLREIQRIRVELEGVAAYRVGEIATAENIAEFERINAAFIKAAATSSSEAARINREFHFAILHVAGMPIVEGICENMWVLMGPFLRIFHERIPVRQLTGDEHKHHDFIAALKRHDPDAAKLAMQDDIRWSEVLVRMLEQEEAEAESAEREARKSKR